MSESNKKLLILSNNEQLVRTMNRTLTREGFDVEVVYTMADARVSFADAVPSVIISDWNIGDGKPEQFLLEAKANPGVERVILMDAGGAYPNNPQLKEGGIEVIEKPFRLEQLIDIIRAQIDAV